MICLTCKIDKKQVLMVKRNDRCNGYRSLCKSCKRAKNRTTVETLRKAQYYQDNKEHIHKMRKQRRYNNLNERIANSLRARLRSAIKENWKQGSAVGDLGCSIEEFRRHLESKFQDNMSWDNYGKWHIDHMAPLSKFDLTKREELLTACHYTNLQPLWAKDNLRKSNRLVGGMSSLF